MRRLHWTRSCASSLDNFRSDKSFLMLSNHLRFGLPLLLFPGTTITISPIYSSLLNTCPYHFNPLSCAFLDISPTFKPYNYFIPNSVQLGDSTHPLNIFKCFFLSSRIVETRQRSAHGRCVHWSPGKYRKSRTWDGEIYQLDFSGKIHQKHVQVEYVTDKWCMAYDCGVSGNSPFHA